MIPPGVIRRLLLVEDNPGDAELIADVLAAAGSGMQVTHVPRLADARAALHGGQFDAVLLDLHLPDGEGVESVKRLRVDRPDVPILVMTGADNEALALDCIAAGAQTYIAKAEMGGGQLRRAIDFSVVRAREASAQRRADALMVRLRHSQRFDTLGALSAGIAHDLNNTLQPVFNIVPWLETMVHDEQSLKGLEMIRSAAMRAKELVKEIVEFSRDVPQTPEPVQLDELVDAVLPMLGAGLPIAIKLHIETEPVPPVLASRSQLYQVVLNLVTNAARAIGSRPGAITVRVAFERGDVMLSVEDDGEGIDEAVKARIFEPFFTTHPSGGGTGLGLAIVKSIVEESGGWIEVSSRKGEGARFVVHLPGMAGQG
ncbi:ATP-binding protein [Sphingomonas sp.]|uniref:sensor histidine kinase n=1 Tax=Sphingomonas sp. TaxID=28214 RepID=UPI001B286902|nr:ATP-binding protein [Sphingomonas sp.]MBO9713532.1 response regulator [Sphingomonas sp.]